MFLLCPLSAASSRPSLPPSSGAHLLLQALLARWRSQQLWLLWLRAAEQTASAKTLWEHRETPAATVWFSTAATRGRQTPYNSCKRLHPCCSGGQRWSQYIGVILRWYVGHSAINVPERDFSHTLICSAFFRCPLHCSSSKRTSFTRWSSSPERLLLTSSPHSSRKWLRAILAQQPSTLQFTARGLWDQTSCQWSSVPGRAEWRYWTNRT